MAAVGAALAPIPFRVVRVQAVRDAIGPGGHVFLLPDEQSTARITAMHDRLYEGELRGYLRQDIAFVPHVTVAADRDFGLCETLAERLTADFRAITGIISGIELVDVESTPVATLHQCPLQGT